MKSLRSDRAKHSPSELQLKFYSLFKTGGDNALTFDRQDGIFKGFERALGNMKESQGLVAKAPFNEVFKES